MPPRWDGDERGYGIGEATRLVSGASDLVAAFSAPAWVAERPGDHLRPHIENWCRHDRRLALSGASTDASNAYVLDLKWCATPVGVGAARAAVFSLIGSFAESATYIRQRRVPGDGDDAAARLQFEVGTGELAPDTKFAPHGHVVIINVAGALIEESLTSG
jgi:hypothetical protein